MTKISIIVPCFNQAQYLEEALQSVLEQTYLDWECIIVNDGSPDHADEIAQKWVAKDDRFKYVFQENGGLSSARNAGLDFATGDYIQFLDSDDILSNKKLEISIGSLFKEDKGNKNIVITNFRMFTTNSKKSTLPYCNLTSELFNLSSIVLQWDTVFTIPIHCGLFSMNLFNDFNFPNDLKAKEDWIMWIHIFQKEPVVKFIAQPLVLYRYNPDGMTNNPQLLEQNKLKAILLLKNIITEEVYSHYLYYSLVQKYNEISKLRTTIYNYQNSATYKLAQKIKETFFFKIYFKIIKK
jgi:hypothetical protein